VPFENEPYAFWFVVGVMAFTLIVILRRRGRL